MNKTTMTPEHAAELVASLTHLGKVNGPISARRAVEIGGMRADDIPNDLKAVWEVFRAMAPSYTSPEHSILLPQGMTVHNALYILFKNMKQAWSVQDTVRHPADTGNMATFTYPESPLVLHVARSRAMTVCRADGGAIPETEASRIREACESSLKNERKLVPRFHIGMPAKTYKSYGLDWVAEMVSAAHCEPTQRWHVDSNKYLFTYDGTWSASYLGRQEGECPIEWVEVCHNVDETDPAPYLAMGETMSHFKKVLVRVLNHNTAFPRNQAPWTIELKCDPCPATVLINRVAAITNNVDAFSYNTNTSYLVDAQYDLCVMASPDGRCVVSCNSSPLTCVLAKLKDALPALSFQPDKSINSSHLCTATFWPGEVPDPTAVAARIAVLFGLQPDCTAGKVLWDFGHLTVAVHDGHEVVVKATLPTQRLEAWWAVVPILSYMLGGPSSLIAVK